jgi:hypothetical protein
MAVTATANSKKISHGDRALDPAMIIHPASTTESALKTGTSANSTSALIAERGSAVVGHNVGAAESHAMYIHSRSCFAVHRHTQRF